jgi:uncharacterized protein (TIGR04255 family)
MIPPHSIRVDLTEAFPHLAAAPIAEAVIHWRARARTWPDMQELRQKLNEQLPDYPDCRPQHQLQLEGELAADGTTTQIRRTTWQGFRLISHDNLHVVQFTRDGIVFSRLSPYENWDAFVEEGWRLWRSFVELAAPAEVQRLGTRFINRIALRPSEDVRQYLTSPPECLESVGLPTAGFLYQSRHTVPSLPFDVNVIRTVQPSGSQPNEGLGLIVDIDVGTTQALTCDDSALQDHLRTMHWLKNRVFFNLLLPDAIERFKKGTA